VKTFRQFNNGQVPVWLFPLALAFLPLLDSPFVVYLTSMALIFGIFAMAYDLLYGYTGMVSFGHSVFYGVPAYAIAVVCKTVFNFGNPLVTLGAALSTGLVLGLIVGFFCTFTRGIYLALVTFAFAQIFSLLVLSDPMGMTLGENGVMGLRPAPVSLGQYNLNLFSGVGLYYSALVLLCTSYLVIRRVVESPLGDVLKGIKQNEARLLSLGYNTRPYKIMAFMLSGLFSALAGTLTVFLNNSAVPSLVDWSVGAEILLITILGGAGTLIGPIIGAFIVIFTESFCSCRLG
jgi:branched-chain amino acid transport system permease protein